MLVKQRMCFIYNCILHTDIYARGCRYHDRMVVEFTTTCVLSTAYHL